MNGENRCGQVKLIVNEAFWTKSVEPSIVDNINKLKLQWTRHIYKGFSNIHGLS